MTKLAALICLLPMLSCFPDARFVMHESLTEYDCEPELVAEMCVNEMEKRDGN